MRAVNCMNGHFVNADAFKVCPVCGADLNDASSRKKRKKDKKGLFGKKKKNEAVAAEPVKNNVTVAIFNPPTNDATQENTYSQTASDNIIIDNNKPDDPFTNLVSLDQLRNMSSFNENYSSNYESFENNSEDDYEGTGNDFDDESSNEDAFAESDGPVGDLASEIQKIATNNNNKTQGFFSSDKASVGATSNESAEPVVGWLVCTKGPHLGESFVIVSGRNSVGRSRTNTICISKDNSVSRDKHTWVIYEPKERKFFIQVGESSGLTYVNGQNILQSVEIKDREIMEIGTTTLMLVALCDEKFSWEGKIE